MRVYLASPHTLTRFKNGRELMQNIILGREEDIYIYIYIAGGISGNLKPALSRFAKGELTSENLLRSLEDENFLAGGESRHWLYDMTSPEKENESVFSRDHPLEKRGGYDPIILKHRPYILESFYYADKDTERLIPYYGDFLLDSGAFTFMQGTSGAVDWDDYIRRYASFIKRNKIQKYFELDIDAVVGYDKVLKYRDKLENLVGWQSIPVWHISRGLDEYIKMCNEYDYVAIGGIVSGEITKERYRYFPSLIAEAHKNNAKVHGLGFTNLALLPKYHFDSVDSTAWTTGNRFGYIYFFDGKTMKKIDVPKGKRLNSRQAALRNYTEWIKFQKYAERAL